MLILEKHGLEDDKNFYMESNTVPSKVWHIIIACSICLTIIYFYHFYKWDRRYGEFERIDKSTAIESTITVLEEYKGYTYIRLPSNEQYVVGNLFNRLYSPPEFFKHVFSGDSISKRADSDTLYLHKKHSFGPTKMYFLIR